MTDLEKLLQKRELIRSQIDALEKIENDLIYEIGELKKQEYLSTFNFPTI